MEQPKKFEILRVDFNFFFNYASKMKQIFDFSGFSVSLLFLCGLVSQGIRKLRWNYHRSNPLYNQQAKHKSKMNAQQNNSDEWMIIR